MKSTALLAACTICVATADWPYDRAFTEVRTTSKMHPLGYEVKSSTYLSPAMPLRAGQVVFTNANKTPLKMPPSGSKITGFTGEVVDVNNASVPLTFVYDHHWIAIDKDHKNDLCVGFENYVFGIGAESRNSPQTFPAGYGYPVPDGDAWGGNIHLLHTQNLSTEYSGGSLERASKECNECYYAPGKGAECTLAKNGTFDCCGDKCYDGSCSCPTVAGAPTVETPYYLQYTVDYVLPGAAAKKLKDVRVGVWTTPNCAAYYSVVEDTRNPESSSSSTFTIPHSAEMVHATGHLHTGAINISLWHNGALVCTSYPTYGTQVDVAGNERGHLVAMSTCLDKDDPSTGALALRKGDTVRLDAHYYVGSQDARIAPSPGGTHLNVMAYMYVVFDLPADQAALEPAPEEKRRRRAAAGGGCNAALVEPCGRFIGAGARCIECAGAGETALALAAANCSVAHVEATCQGKAAAGGPLAQALPQDLPPYIW